MTQAACFLGSHELSEHFPGSAIHISLLVCVLPSPHNHKSVFMDVPVLGISGLL